MIVGFLFGAMTASVGWWIRERAMVQQLLELTADLVHSNDSIARGFSKVAEGQVVIAVAVRERRL